MSAPVQRRLPRERPLTEAEIAVLTEFRRSPDGRHDGLSELSQASRDYLFAHGYLELERGMGGCQVAVLTGRGAAAVPEECNIDEGLCIGGWDRDLDAPGPCAECRAERASAMAEARAEIGGLEWHRWNDARLAREGR